MDFFKGDRRDDWQTPPYVFDLIASHYTFAMDLAASSVNSKCRDFYCELEDSLRKNWDVGLCWLNPPFSKAKQFFTKAKGHKLIAIYKAANLETVLWQDIILPHCDWVCFIKRRVNYLNHMGVPSTGVTFGSALIGYGIDCRVSSMGKVWRPNAPV